MPPQLPVRVYHTLDNDQEVFMTCKSEVCSGTFLDEDDRQVDLLCTLLPTGRLNCPGTPSARPPSPSTVGEDTKQPPPLPSGLGPAGSTEGETPLPFPTTSQPTPSRRSMPPLSRQELDEQRTFL